MGPLLCGFRGHCVPVLSGTGAPEVLPGGSPAVGGSQMRLVFSRELDYTQL
jgi:hypothetical protein